MKKRVIYNVYYDAYEVFKDAVMLFFSDLNRFAPESELGRTLRGRVRDKFRSLGEPLS
jgi:hypothetical protein